jgi:hypothetical protein
MHQEGLALEFATLSAQKHLQRSQACSQQLSGRQCCTCCCNYVVAVWNCCTCCNYVVAAVTMLEADNVKKEMHWLVLAFRKQSAVWKGGQLHSPMEISTSASLICTSKGRALSCSTASRRRRLSVGQRSASHKTPPGSCCFAVEQDAAFCTSSECYSAEATKQAMQSCIFSRFSPEDHSFKGR